MIEIPVTPPGAIWFGSENTETEMPYKIPPNVKHKISKKIFFAIFFLFCNSIIISPSFYNQGTSKNIHIFGSLVLLSINVSV